MQLVETETSPLGYASQNKESAVFEGPSASAAPPPKTPPRPPGMQRWRGSWTTLQVDHSHPVQLRTSASGSRQGHPYA